MIFKIFKVTFALLLFTFFVPHEASQFYEEKLTHKAKTLNNYEIDQLASLTDENYFRDALQHILVPRVVGTPGHERVKEFITTELKDLGFDTKQHSFNANTPNLGKLTFTNIIGATPENATRFLVLACHYDSKYFPEFKFYAATDSAVPCAMLLHIGKVLKPVLQQSNKVGLMLIFFDGEEAFYHWDENDSLYGSRQLAAQWERTPYPSPGSTTNNLHRIDLLVLLDLLGTKDQQLYSLFQQTFKWHSLLAQIERRLKSLAIIPSEQPLHFLEKSTFGFIDDDHKPFLVRNVSILHLIPPVFPKVWHTAADNYTALDFPTIDTMNKVFQVFTYAYIKGSQE